MTSQQFLLENHCRGSGREDLTATSAAVILSAVAESRVSPTPSNHARNGHVGPTDPTAILCTAAGNKETTTVSGMATMGVVLPTPTCLPPSTMWYCRNSGSCGIAKEASLPPNSVGERRGRWEMGARLKPGEPWLTKGRLWVQVRPFHVDWKKYLGRRKKCKMMVQCCKF